MFAWEKGQWDDFLKVLDGFQVCTDLQDQLVWKYSVSRTYSPNSFTRVVTARVERAARKCGWVFYLLKLRFFVGKPCSRK